jgi:hypothetical protein
MPRLLKIIGLSALILLVLLVVVSRYLPPGTPAHPHGGS